VLLERDLDVTAGALASWLARVEPCAADVAVTDLRLPTAGASNETILFTASWTDGAEPRRAEFVLRVQPQSNQLFLKTDVFFQWDMMAGLARHGDVPVPPLRWREPDPGVLGAPFFVMQRVPGEVPNGHQSALLQRLAPAERARLFEQGLEMLARVHRVDWQREFTFLLDTDAEPGLPHHLTNVDRWYEWARAGRHFDDIEAALAHLHDAMPPDAAPSLSWGDSRLGNLIFDPGSQHVTAVLDWEIADISTAQADLGWWLMFERLFADQTPGGVPDGVPDRDATLARYEAASGFPLRHLRYYDLLAWTRLAITFVRHVDVERGTAKEQMYTELNGYVTGVVRELLVGADR